MAFGNRSARNSDGFSLVEVVIGLSIMSIVLGGSFAALMQGNRMQDLGYMTTIGTQVMQNEIERLRNMHWLDFVDLPETSEIEIDEGFGKTGERFTCTRTISAVRLGETRKVTLEIRWKSLGERTHTRQLWTFISRNGRAYVGESPYLDWTDDTEILW